MMRNGTPHFGGASLCASCKRATRIQGERAQEFVTYCHVAERDIKFRVVECNSHEAVTQQSLYELKQIAWLVDVDNRGVIGFIKPKDRRERRDLQHEIDHLPEPEFRHPPTWRNDD